MKRVFFVVALLFGSVANIEAQKLTTRDSDQILSQVDVLMEDYQLLLNTITNSGMSLKSTELVIANSFAGENRKRQFWDGNVIIEDDVNPEKAIADSAADLPVKKYLEELDLLYMKSETPSVLFNNISVSNAKKRDNFYVKVYFDCLFGNQHKKSKVPYRSVRRVAEVRIEKIDGKWIPYIMSVRYFEKQDSINDIQYDVELIEVADIGEEVGERLESAQQSYSEYINKGETALRDEDYEAAEAAFEVALKIRPNSHHPLRKLREIREMDWYTIYYTEATKAKQRRDYDAAINSYKKALEVKFTDASVRSEVAKSIDGLNNHIRNRDLFESSFSAGKHDDLIKDYTKRLKAQRMSDFEEAEMHFYLGRCYVAKNNPKDALKAFTEAIRKDGNYEQALLERASLHTTLHYTATKKEEKMQHLREAHADFSVVISNNPKVADNYIHRASVRELMGNFVEATSDYEQVISLEPMNANRYYTKALYHIRQKEEDLAHASLSKAIKLDPAFAAAYYKKGMLEYEQFSELGKAAEDFKLAVANGLDDEGKNNIANISTKHYQEGVNLYQKAEYSKATEEFEKATTIKDTNYDAYFMKGEALYAQKSYPAAIRSYTDALNHNDQLHVAHYKRGEAYYHLKEYQQAVGEYEKIVQEIKFEEAIKHNPVAGALWIDSQIGIGKSKQALGDYEDAISLNENTIKLIKKSGSKISGVKSSITTSSYVSQEPFDEKSKLSKIYSNIGRCLYEMKNYKAATKSLDKALGYNKKNSTAYYNRGAAYYALYDFKKATNDFSSNIANGSNKPTDYFVKAQAYQMANDHTEAIFNYRNAINLDSNLIDAYYFSGISHFKLNMLMEALLYYNDYSRKSQQADLNERFYAERGIIKLKLNLYDEAKADFDKALEMDTDNAEALYGLGCLYTLNNRPDEAILEFEKAFRTNMISRKRIKEDTPSLLFKITNDQRFKKLVKAIDKKSEENKSFMPLYESDEASQLVQLPSSK